VTKETAKTPKEAKTIALYRRVEAEIEKLILSCRSDETKMAMRLYADIQDIRRRLPRTKKGGLKGMTAWETDMLDRHLVSMLTNFDRSHPMVKKLESLTLTLPMTRFEP